MSDDGMVHPYSPLHKLFALIQPALSEIVGKKIKHKSLEQVAILIYEAMSTRNRLYHRVEHIFNIDANAGPHEALSYIFHDIVYWQIDRARHPQIRKMMNQYTPDERGRVHISDAYFPPTAEDMAGTGRIARFLFGLEPGTVLTVQNGLNEFLSACIAEHLLKPILPAWDLIRIIACIEGTIPFRSLEDIAHSPFTLLASRITKLCAHMDLKKSQKEIDIAVLAAVRVAHDDIASFAKDDVTEFLQEAWEISWEMNPALQRETYRIGDLRAVLMRQEAFYSALMPRDIFPKYKQYPGDAKLIDLYAKAGRNLQIASKYLKAKILALVTLEAVADITGGDIPLLLFVGYHPRRHLLPEWESMLDGLSIDRPKASHEDFIVQLLLESGRTEGSKFDTAKSPVAAFLFTHLNEAAFDRAYAEAMQYLSGSFSSK